MDDGQAPHGEEDPDGVVLPVDPVGDVVQQPSDGRLLQGHGGREAAAHQGGPHLAHTVPVPHTGQGQAAMHAQQAVQSPLTRHAGQISTRPEYLYNP